MIGVPGSSGHRQGGHDCGFTFDVTASLVHDGPSAVYGCYLLSLCLVLMRAACTVVYDDNVPTLRPGGSTATSFGPSDAELLSPSRL